MSVLARLRAQGVDARLDSLELWLRAPAAALTDDVLADAREHRAELVDGLLGEHQPAPAPLLGTEHCADCGARTGTAVRCPSCAAARVERARNLFDSDYFVRVDGRPARWAAKSEQDESSKPPFANGVASANPGEAGP